MLKYKLNTKTARTDLQKLVISNVESTEAPYEGTNKVLLTCYMGERGVVHENDTVVAIYDVEIPRSYNQNRTTIVEEYTVVGVNDENMAFSIIYDKFREMEPDFARKETLMRYNKNGEMEDVSYLVIYFNVYHNLMGDETDDNLCTVYLSDNVSTSVEQLIEMKGSIVDNYTIRFEINETNQEAYDRIFSTDVFKAQNYAPLTHFKILQENFLFREDYSGMLLNADLYIQKNVGFISIPITNTFATDLYKTLNYEGFVNKQVEMALNKSAENEKDVYRPVLVTEADDDQLVASDLRHIKFNFHFRKRSDDNWVVDNRFLWNGVQIYSKDDLYNAYGYKFNNKYFSYSNRDRQSDLLSYLSFTNEDVKYRRNSLKKSFVRLLFYDSTDPFKQKLISYSTIFVDSGTLLDRYMKNVVKDKLNAGYVQIKEQGISINEITGLNGIRVDRELNISYKMDEDELEDCRLSSQLVVSDKFLSSSSSEGFYLYLWKDNVGDGVPNDIYMKVEYNHAKFGRIIPFMMPYRESGHKKQIKSFDDVVKDVFNGSADNGGDFNKGYTVEEYRKYSYIHFKYERVEEFGGYVYYLDENYTNVEIEGDSLILNLYEANVK